MMDIVIIGVPQPRGKLNLSHRRGSAMASPGGKLSSEARLMRNGETDRFCMQFVKKVQFEKLYVLICLRPISENVAVPHPPLRGTFPPGEGISPPNSAFPGCRVQHPWGGYPTDSHTSKAAMIPSPLLSDYLRIPSLAIRAR